MTTTRIDRIRTLLKGIETGDPEAVSVISPTQYIQHNPQTQTGREGLDFVAWPTGGRSQRAQGCLFPIQDRRS